MVVAGLAGCAVFHSAASLPTARSVVRDQLVIFSDFDLPTHHRLLDELVAQRGDLTRKLKLPQSDEPIHVYLFDSPTRFRSFIDKHYPGFPSRRAFFVETDTQLSVYAHWGDRVAEDLRHEVCHGYLHAVVPHLPLWLDEGLAEYFEVPRGQNGVHLPHLTALLEGYQLDRWRPDLTRLEALASASEMRQQDYAESWAWAHFLLESAGPRCESLRNYLARLRMTGAASPFSDVLRSTEPLAEQELIRHLESLSR